MKYSTLFLLFFVSSLYAAANLVVNPGFEEVAQDGRPASWNEVKPAYQIENGAGRNGGRGIRFENSNPSFYRFPAQRVDLKPGSIYKFSVWVRTEDLIGDESGATLCLEWLDEKGKWMGGSYPHGVKGTHDWQKVEGSTRIPAGATSVSVKPYVRKGMTGRAWFDDISITRFVPPAVGVICGSAYRGIAAGETVKFFVELALSDADLSPDKVRGFFYVKDADGKAVSGAPADYVHDDSAGYELPTASLPAGCYTVEFELKSLDGRSVGRSSCMLERVSQLPERKVYIDSHRRTIVDGKPFFPLGMYWHSIKKEPLETFAKGPFNCMMPYGAPNKEKMDMAYNAGLKVIYSVKDIYSDTRWAPKGIKTLDDEVNFIKQKVNSYKDHPALLAWYINDELPLSMIDRLTARRDLMEQLDPGHPAWVVLYQYNQVRSYLPSFDIIGTDPYPIPKKPAGMALEWTRITRDQCFGVRPMWQVPQVFDWGGYKKGKDREESRAPTLAEMRTMAWQCIAAGANGLVFYSYFDLYKMAERDSFEKRWKDVCTMAGEIKRFIPVMLSVDPVPDFSWIKPAQVQGRAWSYKGETHVLIVNGGQETAEARLRPDKTGIKVVTEFGNTPEVQENGTMVFDIDPLKPVMVRF